MEQSKSDNLKDVKTKRLNIHVSEEMHHKLKVLSARRWITIKELVTRSIIRYIEEEKKYE